MSGSFIERRDVRDLKNVRERCQFDAMLLGQAPQTFFSGRRELDADLAAVRFAWRTRDQTERFASADKRDDTVLLCL